MTNYKSGSIYNGGKFSPFLILTFGGRILPNSSGFPKGYSSSWGSKVSGKYGVMGCKWSQWLVVYPNVVSNIVLLFNGVFVSVISR